MLVLVEILTVVYTAADERVRPLKSSSLNMYIGRWWKVASGDGTPPSVRFFSRKCRMGRRSTAKLTK